MAAYQGPARSLELYERLAMSVEGVERKGAANPYTSRNGWMTSFQYDWRISFQYRREMKDFVMMPHAMLEDLDAAREWFVRSWDHTGTLKPK